MHRYGVDEDIVPIASGAGPIPWATREQIEADGLARFVLPENDFVAQKLERDFEWHRPRREEKIEKWVTVAQTYHVGRLRHQTVLRVWEIDALLNLSPQGEEKEFCLLAYGQDGHLLNSDILSERVELYFLFPWNCWPGGILEGPVLPRLIRAAAIKYGVQHDAPRIDKKRGDE